MTPFVDDPDFRLYVGDVRETLAHLDADSVDCVVTSPPYFGLRDYGTGTWEGGDPECDHSRRTSARVDSITTESRPSNSNHEREGWKGGICGRCGAISIDQQIGLESTPDEYVAELVGVFREVRRVLAPHGTVWLNLGDSYAASLGQRKVTDKAGPKQATNAGSPGAPSRYVEDLKPKDLVGIPWRVAFALQQPYYTGTITDERDRVWLAAMIDAEGCIYIHKRGEGLDNGQGYTRKNATYGSGMEISNTNLAIIERIAAITGRGSISSAEKGSDERRRQTLYRWNLRTNECRDVLREVYPHLVAKQHQARIAIGCPSSGDKAAAAHAALKGLHQGTPTTVDFPEPESMFEPGWYLRSDVIWAKPNPMPESVTDRPTKSHEYVFMLTKSPRYYFDQEAVREPYETTRTPGRAIAETDHYGTVGGNGNRGLSAHLAAVRGRLAAEQGDPAQPTLDESLPPEAPRGADGRRQTAIRGQKAGTDTHENYANREGAERWANEGRNMRAVWEIADETDDAAAWMAALFADAMRQGDESLARTVWEIATQPYSGAHFATYPEALVRRCILASAPERVCTTCGKPSERLVARTPMVVRPSERREERRETDEFARTAFGGTMLEPAIAETVGWSECGCAYGLKPDDLEVILTPTGDATDDPTMEIGRRGLARPRSEDSGTRPITRYEQRGYAQQLREWSDAARREFLDTFGVTETAWEHYLRVDRAGARPLPATMLDECLRRGWLEQIVLPTPTEGTWRAGVVLDPFMGSGTTAKVARDHRRHAIGIELNPEYAALCAARLQQLSLFA